MTTRRLSAVLVADVVGFSAQMERDDAGTLARLRAMRAEVVDPSVAANGGRIVKTTGDGLLVEFGSADASLRCAIAIQRVLAGRNASMPDDERLDLRIGINLGDVIADGDDIFGDGVNVAARLESLAPAGGICVSQAVRDQVHGTLDVEFADTGEQQVKNIARPLRTFNIAFGQPASSQPRKAQRRRTMSVGVVPFMAFDEVPGTVRHAQSLARDFAGMLARCSTFITVIPMADDRSENVRYLAHGELRAAPDSYVLHARLLDNTSGQQLWSESALLGATTDPLATGRALHGVVWRLYRSLVTLELRRLAAATEADPEPLDIAVRAISLYATESDVHERLRKQARMFEHALEKDPSLVPALTGLANVAHEQLAYDLAVDRQTLVARMDALTARALTLNDLQPSVWYLRSCALMYMGRPNAALQACDKAIEMQPLSANLLMHRACLLALWGRPHDALRVIDEAWSMNPARGAADVAIECLAHTLAGNYATAIEKGEKLAGLSANLGYEDQVFLAAAYAQVGDLRQARALRDSVLRSVPAFTIAMHRSRSKSLEPAYLELVDTHVYAGLRKAGFPEA